MVQFVLNCWHWNNTNCYSGRDSHTTNIDFCFLKVLEVYFLVNHW